MKWNQYSSGINIYLRFLYKHKINATDWYKGYVAHNLQIVLKQTLLFIVNSI